MAKRSKFGWLDCILGVLLLVLGLYTFAGPTAASGLVLPYSLLAIMTGASDILFYMRLKDGTGLCPAVSLTAGFLSILAGFMLLLMPMMGPWVFRLAFSIWTIAHSAARLVGRPRGTGKAATLSLVLHGINALIGVVMLLGPSLLATQLGWLVAAALVIHGAGGITEAFLQTDEGEDDSDEQEYLFWH